MISIVVPIFNEQDNLPVLHARLTQASKTWLDDYELIFVDDGSVDNSLSMMREMAASDTHLNIVKLSRNFGHQAAISAGLQMAKGDAIVIMDGDLQDPPEELHHFLAKWREGYQVVYAIRTKRKENIFKRIAYKSFYRLLALISDIDIPLDSGDFCVIDRKVADVMRNLMPEQIRFVRGLRAYAGFKQIGITYERAARASGEAKYTFVRLVKLAFDGLFDFSAVPLRLASYLGFLVAIPSFLMGIFFIFHRVFDFKILGYSPADIPGMATLTTGIFFLGGVMLIILGIIGEYIGRIYVEVKRRPFFIIEEIIKK